LNILELSGSGIVTIPACIKRFVALGDLNWMIANNFEKFKHFHQFHILDRVDARGCMSLELYNKCWLPELPVADLWAAV
jgi:hypothetical protein